MTERPILFSAPMVRAIIARRKTQTRRLVTPPPPATEAVLKRAGITYSLFDRGTPGLFRVCGPVWAVRELTGVADPKWRCPYGAPGDRLWVKEAIRIDAARPPLSVYEADNAATVADAWPWKRPRLPGMFCPRGLSRMTLEVTSVRVERLQAISEADAKAEGVDAYVCRSGFEYLWDEINGKRAPWSDNPWVWVVEFRRFEAEERTA